MLSNLKDRIFLQFDLEESSFNPLRGKQIDHPYVYFKNRYRWSIYLSRNGLEEDTSESDWR
jgi:hypothetical protein